MQSSRGYAMNDIPEIVENVSQKLEENKDNIKKGIELVTIIRGVYVILRGFIVKLMELFYSLILRLFGHENDKESAILLYRRI
ncbi:MAG: hypothetical protein LBS34_02185 [Rickettsiales bacterium]|jgi:hypothetical protein|nr:hypothetical protein [Rickettsiales bacterium]